MRVSVACLPVVRPVLIYHEGVVFCEREPVERIIASPYVVYYLPPTFVSPLQARHQIR
jgi:hypothetical protein